MFTNSSSGVSKNNTKNTVEVAGVNSVYTTTVIFYNDSNCDEIWDALEAYTDRNAPTNTKKTFIKLLIYEQAHEVIHLLVSHGLKVTSWARKTTPEGDIESWTLNKASMI